MPDESEVSRDVMRLQEAMPLARHHRDALKVLHSDFSYARKYADGTWVALVKFGPNIAAMFGLTRDVLVIYSDDVELQPRLFKSFPQRLADLSPQRAAEDHFFAVATRDPNGARKLDTWSDEEPYLAFVLPPRSEDERKTSQSILFEMKSRLASRNLYDETLPVTGRDFFGRRSLLTQMQEELRQGNVCGVFGLRKTGKTSTIQELRARYATEASRIFVLRDLETLPKDSPRLGREFVQDLRQAFLGEFRPKDVRTGDLNDLSVEASVGDLRRALQTSLADCRKRNIRVVLALDEIEYLVGDARTLAEGNRPEVPEILGALRSLVQENSNFNVIFSGITSAVIHRGELYGLENPMFSWAKIYYVPPMSRKEINGLTTEVGTRMALTWRADALDAVYEQSKGNVFLHRTLAATVVRRLNDDSTSPSVNLDDVEASLKPWRRSIAERLREMLKAFDRHYPTEATILETFIHDRDTFDELEGVYPAEVHRLLELALLQELPSGDVMLGALGSRLVETGFK